jgi:hypothetical protein
LENKLKTEDYQDRVDTFKNTLLTQASRISKLYNEFEINTKNHASTLKDAEQVKSWNMVANNIEEVVEIIELLVSDLEEYDRLWYDYLNIEDDVLPNPSRPDTSL